MQIFVFHISESSMDLLVRISSETQKYSICPTHVDGSIQIVITCFYKETLKVPHISE